MIIKFVDIFHDWSYDFYVKKQDQNLTVEYLIEKKICFKYFSEARYATGVMF